MFLEYGAKVNDIFGSASLCVAIKKGYTKIVALLLKHKVGVNVQDRSGKTPLYMAVEGGHTEIVELLLEYGADVNVKNDLDETPLHMAAEKGHTRIVELLLEYGAKVNVKNSLSKTPFYIANKKIYTRIAELPFILLVYGAELNDDDREKINNRSELKRCLEAFEEITNKKFYPCLNELGEANIKRNKKENAKVIRKYINNKANQEALIAEFKTISEKCSSDEQLNLTSKFLLGFAEHLGEQYLLKYKRDAFKTGALVELIRVVILIQKAEPEQKTEVKLDGLEIKDYGIEYQDALSLSLTCKSISNEANLKVDIYYNKLKEKAEALLIKLKETVCRPRSALTEAQPEAASSQSHGVA